MLMIDIDIRCLVYWVVENLVENLFPILDTRTDLKNHDLRNRINYLGVQSILISSKICFGKSSHNFNAFRKFSV